MAEFHVVGYRDRGDTVILETTASAVFAQRRAAVLAEHAEGYTRITVEEHDGNVLADFNCDRGAKQEREPMTDNHSTDRIREAHQRVKAARASSIAPQAGPAWAQMNRLERSAAVRALVKELGSQASAAEVLAEARRRGWEDCSPKMIERARRLTGLSRGTPRRGGGTRKKPQRTAETTAPTAHAPADGQVSITALRDFLGAVAQVGGPAVASQLLDVLKGT